MTDLITLLSLLVAVFAMCVYFRMARVSDKNIAAANKHLDFLNRWRKRYSRRVRKFVEEMNAKDKQIENIKAILRKELEDGRERDVVLNHFRNKYHAQQDSMAMVAEFFYLHFKPETTRKDDKRFHELKESILITLVAQGYEDLRPLLPKKLRNMKSAEESLLASQPIAKMAHSLAQCVPGMGVGGAQVMSISEGVGQCPPDRVVR
jgi:hypothetical protein